MATNEPKFYWHIHHDTLLEETSNIQERIAYIKAEKSEAEISLRLKLMTPVLHPEKLPVRFRKASEAYDKAKEDCIKAGEAYNKAEEDCYKAREAYYKAGEAYYKAEEDCYKAKEAYHKAREAYNKTEEAYYKASEDCIKADEVFGKAWEDCIKAWGDYHKARKDCNTEIEKLHREEHPDCPWNGETIFGKVD